MSWNVTMNDDLSVEGVAGAWVFHCSLLESL